MAVHICLLLLISAIGISCYASIGEAKEQESKYIKHIYRDKQINLQTRNRIFVTISMILMFLVQSLRKESVGIDTAAYMYWFKNIQKGIYPEWEILFIKLNILVGKFTQNPQWLIAAVSLITVVGFGCFILINSDNEVAFWPVFLFFVFNQYFVTMNLLRQGCSMAIGINAYSVFNRRIKKQQKIQVKDIIVALGLITIASMFHLTGLAVLPIIFPFFFRKKTFFKIGALLIICIIITMYFNRIFIRLLSFMPQYSSYEDRESAQALLMTVNNIIYLLIKGACVIGFLVYCWEEKTDDSIYCIACVLIMSCTMTLLQTRTRLAVRFAYFFDVFLIIAIPKIVSLYVENNESSWIAYLALYLLGFGYYIYVLNAGARGCVPYYFFWQ